MSAHPLSNPSTNACTASCSPTRSRPRSPWRCIMSEQALRLSPPKRPERTVTLDAVGAIGDAARPLSLFERLAENTLVRRLVILVVLGALWQAYATWVANPLLFPTLTETLDALWEAIVRGPLVERTLTSIQVLLMGYGIGLAL